ncbi:hypothetical protein BDW22DRAFT_431325 [Trametopsis cervina]|nr:hypothetical protein BDW22DRAFT_431325 [Trametopsis cervina]
MAMSIPAVSPSSSPAPQSPQSSADGSNGPSTPVSPSHVQTLSLPPPVDSNGHPSQEHMSSGAGSGVTSSAAGQPQKRKPSRRANTAERRATHNAVERARRETLNGRFLDLAALLPNLSQIRRPSKSSIVNSSIAHIHASRRHRLLAARELRLVKLEADALRRELNEWRDRSNLPRIDEPVRGEGFQMILSGEVEILSAGPIEEEAGDDEYGDEDGPFNSGMASQGVNSMNDEPEDIRGHPFAHSVHPSHHNPHPHMGHHTNSHHGLHLQTMMPRGPHGGAMSSPMIVQSPQAVSFENPAMANMYDPPHMGQYFPPTSESPSHKWSMGPGAPGGGFPQQQFTPPQSSHGPPPPAPYMSGYAQQQRGYGAPQRVVYTTDNDDSSSVGSAGHSPVPSGGLKRARSGSMGSVGSNGEMPSVLGAAAAMGRRQQWAEEGMYAMQGMQGMQQQQQQGLGGAMSGMGMGGRGGSAGMGVSGGNAFANMML